MQPRSAQECCKQHSIIEIALHISSKIKKNFVILRKDGFRYIIRVVLYTKLIFINDSINIRRRELQRRDGMNQGKNTNTAEMLRGCNWVISILLVIGSFTGARSDNSRMGGLIAFSVLVLMIIYLIMFRSYFIFSVFYNDYTNGFSPVGLLFCIVIFAIWPFVSFTEVVKYMDKRYLIFGSIICVALFVLFNIILQKEIEIGLTERVGIAAASFFICLIMVPLFSYTFGHVEYTEQAIVTDYSKDVSYRSGRFSSYVLDVNSATLGSSALDVNSRVYENGVSNGFINIEFCKDVLGNSYYYIEEK